MTSYRLSPDGIRALEQRMRRLFVGSSVAGLLGTIWFVVAIFRQNGSLVRYWWIPIAAGLLTVLLLVFATRKAIAISTSAWQAFSIELGDDYIAGHSGDAGGWRVSADALALVIEMKNKMVLTMHDSRDAFSVPAEIGDDAYQEVRSVLAQWAPIETESMRTHQVRAIVWITQSVALAIVILSPVPWVVVAAFLVQVAFYVWIRLSTRFREARTKTLTKDLIWSAVLTALRFSPWAEIWDRFLRLLYFQ